VKFAYPSKIIIAWAEACGGNAKIRDWLTANNYPELGLFVFALNNRQSARDWLMENNQQHLMAIIRGTEGDPNALMWLRKFKFDILEKVARAADNDDESMHWLVQHNYHDFANLAMHMRRVKNDIEMDNNDVHKFNIE
jgi:hypothetical protein